MPCNKMSINKNYKCDKAGCICLPTDGKSCICVCENENGDITRCNDCKCFNSGNCQCKCDDSKCTCIVTKGADCICVCRDGRGNIKTCDCACFEAKSAKCCKNDALKSCECCRDSPKKGACGSTCKSEGKCALRESVSHGKVHVKDSSCCCVEAEDLKCCKKEQTSKSCECCTKGPEKEACRCNCKCVEKRGFNESRHTVTTSKNYKCDKAGCICLPTGGKSCICVCEDENGDIVRCDDCKCNNSGNCKCKCDDSKCTCIVTKGADCICVCRDGRGNIKTCDCACFEANDTRYKRETFNKSCVCCNKKPEKETCGKNCSCCKEEVMSCECCEETTKKKACGYNGRCDEERGFKESRRVATISKGSKCNKAGYVCLSTSGKSCICVCENEDGDIMRCDDCKCNNSGNCQCKCDDSKCTCIVTKGAHCICVGRDGRGNIKVDDCCAIGPNEAGCCRTKSNGCCGEEQERDSCGKNCSCCKDEAPAKSCECCKKEPENGACGSSCRCDGKREFEVSRRAVTFSKNYNCEKDECVCIPNGEKSCICICEDDKGAFQCKGCKCCSEKLCREKQVRIHRGQYQRSRGQNCKCFDNKRGCKSCCSPKTEEPNACCGNDTRAKACAKAIEYQGCQVNEKTRCCCSYKKIQEDRNIDERRGCVCGSRQTRYRRFGGDDCDCTAKKADNGCTCCN